MLNITFLVGPPASGKTFIARQMMSMFAENRTKLISSSDKKELYKVLKNRKRYDLLIIDEANKKMLRKLEIPIIYWDKRYVDVSTNMSNRVIKPNFNILICSQDVNVYQDLYLYKEFNETNVKMAVIECQFKKPFNN